jgi:Fe-S cluster assembly iron-binding protein IscA
MTIEVTDEAVDMLRRSLGASGAAAVRLRTTRALGGRIDVQVEFADEPTEGDHTIEAGGVRIFVDPEVMKTYPDAVVALEPQHETIVVRPR